MNDISKKTANSLKWTFLNTAFNTAIQPFYRIALAILLSPTDYGYYSIILLIISLAQLLNDVGIGQALIKKPLINYKDTSTLFYFNFLVSLFFAVLFLSSSNIISNYYKFYELEEMAEIISFIIFLSGMSSIFKFYLHKYFYFRASSLLLIGRFFIEIITTLIFILLGFEIWGVMLGLGAAYLFYNLLLIFLAIYKYKFKLKLYFSYEILKEHLSYGVLISFQKLLNFSSNKLDEVLVGGLFGPTTLGQYFLAKSLLFQSQSLLSRSFGQVMLPYFSKLLALGSDIRNYYIRIFNYLIFIGAPLYLSITFFADDFINVFLTSQWQETIEVFQLLAIPTLLMFLNAGLTNTIMIAIGKIKRILAVEIFSTLSFVTIIVLVNPSEYIILVLIYSLYIFFKILFSKLVMWVGVNIKFKSLVIKSRKNIYMVISLIFIYLVIDFVLPGFTIEGVIIKFLTVLSLTIIYYLIFNEKELRHLLRKLKYIIK